MTAVLKDRKGQKRREQVFDIDKERNLSCLNKSEGLQGLMGTSPEPF